VVVEVARTSLSLLCIDRCSIRYTPTRNISRHCSRCWTGMYVYVYVYVYVCVYVCVHVCVYVRVVGVGSRCLPLMFHLFVRLFACGWWMDIGMAVCFCFRGWVKRW
jgi:hypothetical protein